MSYTADFYAIGQASKFVRPGAVRIDSTDLGSEEPGDGGVREHRSLGGAAGFE